MKIFFINTVCGVGSTGNIVTELLHLVKQQGGSGRVAYGYGSAQKVEPDEAYRILSKPAYYIHNALSRLTDHEGLFSASQTQALVEQIIRCDPDVIHLHNLHGHYLHYEILFDYLKRAGKPVVWTLHDCWALTGHCAHYAAAGCDQWKEGCRRCSQLRQYPQCYTAGDVAGNHRRKKRAFTGVAGLHIVTPSHWMAAQAAQSYLRCCPIHTIHTGIDLNIFKPTPGDFRQRYRCGDKFILLGVAYGWGERKGLDVFIELSNRLDPSYQIVLVGTDDASDKLLPPSIISIHRTENQEQLAQIYSAADLFVNPTREEVLGLVNLEALACGTPVVTFRSGGSPECIDESCGCVVPCDDVDALEREIRRIATEKTFSPAACTERASRFDAQVQFARYIDLYEQLSHAEVKNT